MYHYNYVIVMARETVQIRIDEDTSRFVDKLIKSGIFMTKSDALRYIISLGISASEDFPEILDKVVQLKALEKSTGRIPIELTGSLNDMLKERHRFI